MVAGYVRGGRSRRLRPILMAGNGIMLDLRTRTDDQLGSLTVEALSSRASLLADPLSTAAMEWLTCLTAASLPENQSYPALYGALSATLDAIDIAAAARQWAAALARYEMLLLAELGFGLSLDVCTVTGLADDLAFVSPKSGCAVSRSAAAGYEAKLFSLPALLLGRRQDPSLADVIDALAITGHFIARDILVGRARDLLETRMRLTDRLNRAVA